MNINRVAFPVALTRAGVQPQQRARVRTTWTRPQFSGQRPKHNAECLPGLKFRLRKRFSVLAGQRIIFEVELSSWSRTEHLLIAASL